MDKYLTLFTRELDAAFDPETLFRSQKVHTKGWLIHIFGKKGIVINKIKKLQEATILARGMSTGRKHFAAGSDSFCCGEKPGNSEPAKPANNMIPGIPLYAVAEGSGQADTITSRSRRYPTC